MLIQLLHACLIILQTTTDAEQLYDMGEASVDLEVPVCTVEFC